MAQRRIARALASFGGSLQDIAGKELQQKMLLERQAAESALIGQRQAEEFKRQQTAKLIEGLRSGSILPQQMTDAERTTVGGEKGNVMQFTPSDQILSKPIFEKLAEIKKADEIPSNAALFQQRLSQGPIKDLTGLTNIFNTAGAQRSQLEASEAKARQEAATQAGAIAENTKLGENRAANATQSDVERRAASMGRVEATAAGQKQYAQTSNDIRAKVDHAADLLRLETDQANARASAELNTEAGKQRIMTIARATESGSKALPALGTLYDKWLKAKDKIASQAKIVGPAAYDAYAQRSYVGLDPDVRSYFQELEKDLPFLSRLTGEVGNLAEQEQIRQRFGMPTAYDAIQGTGDDKLETALALASKASKLAELNSDPKLQGMDVGQRLAMLDNIIAEGKRQIHEEFSKRRPQPERIPGQGRQPVPDRATLEKMLLGGR